VERREVEEESVLIYAFSKDVWDTHSESVTVLGARDIKDRIPIPRELSAMWGVRWHIALKRAASQKHLHILQRRRAVHCLQPPLNQHPWEKWHLSAWRYTQDKCIHLLLGNT
jgi:hypothetical protein